MDREEKLYYLIDNLRSLPDELADEGIEILVQANETEYAVVLARDKGKIEKAIEILVDARDYLWAALIARNAGMEAESYRLYQEGLGYYIGMEMFGRAISAATALKMPQEEIEALYMKGVEVESRGMNLDGARGMIESAMESIELATIGRDDETSREVQNAIEGMRRDQKGNEK